jgi:transcriptional regulator with XRE-family HTH domain
MTAQQIAHAATNINNHMIAPPVEIIQLLGDCMSSRKVVWNGCEVGTDRCTFATVDGEKGEGRMATRIGWKTTPRGKVPHFTRGDRLAQARKMAGMSAAELADIIGVSRFTVSSWENDHTDLSELHAWMWARATGVDPRWLDERLTEAECRRWAKFMQERLAMFAEFTGDEKGGTARFVSPHMKTNGVTVAGHTLRNDTSNE